MTDQQWNTLLAVRDALATVDDHTRLVLSCGGGMPTEVPTKNIEAFCDEVKKNT